MADRRKRQQEEKEREEEAARKKREREEKARKEREAREKEAKDKDRREKEERAAKEKAERDRVAREKAEKAERERLVVEARERAEQSRLAKLEEERIEKLRTEQVARQEREAAEQAKMVVAQQAQRERAQALAQAEKAAAEKAAADRAALDKLRTIVPVPIRAKTTPRSGNTPHTSPPLPEQSSPAKASSSIRLPSARSQPQPFFPQPTPVGGSFPSRNTQQSFVPGLRAAYPSQSPIFSPQQSNGSSISSNPPPRVYQSEPSPPFELRTAPVGIGFPSAKSARTTSVDEGFSLPTAPIASALRSISGELIDDIRREPAPIGPPRPIGRPMPFLEQPQSSTSSKGPRSPAPLDQVYGSAALGADDEIVRPTRRNPPNGWDVPIAAAPGAGRWSTSPSIWGNATPGEGGTSWRVPSIPARQPSFGGIGGSGTSLTAPVHGAYQGIFKSSGQQPHPQQPAQTQQHHVHH